MSRVIKFIRIVSLRKICFATEQERYAFYMQYARAAGFGSKNTRTRRCLACMFTPGKVLLNFTKKVRSANEQRCQRGLAAWHESSSS
jgi:hypothetical protein